jgi:hypothetical protein
MPNYTIEGGIKFYEELYKMLDDEPQSDESQDLCLITNQPLTENYVTLECNHKFNYMPLFNDIRNHKKKFNSLEAHKLSSNEIRCPYCRNKQKKLLPYYESMGASMKVIGVNAMPEPAPGYQIGTCCYYYPEDSQSQHCSNNVILLEANNKTYCSHHYSLVSYQLKKAAIKKAKEEEKQKAKEEKQKAKEEKQKAKEEEKQKAKEEEKQKAKEEKQKAKEEAKQSAPKKKAKIELEPGPISNSNPIESTQNENETETETETKNDKENIVISSSTCSQMVKSGPNKGHQCKCKVYLSLLCKRHYSALTPTNIGTLEVK